MLKLNYSMSSPTLYPYLPLDHTAHNYLILVFKLAKLNHSPFPKTPHIPPLFYLFRPHPISSRWPGSLFHDSSWSLWQFVNSDSYESHYLLLCSCDPGNLKSALCYNSLCVCLLYKFTSYLVLVNSYSSP